MTAFRLDRHRLYLAQAPWRAFAVIAALFCLLASASILAPAAAADRNERILQFDSEIWVHRDGSMTVRETIEVNAARRKIRRGIYRDFPTVYQDRHGTRVVVDFDVEAVTRDGRPEPYHTQRISNGVRVYIGDKDKYIRTGRHTYTLTYRTDRQLGFFKDYDELYWNVTGNGWDFEIEKARAIIHLPEGARVQDYSAYTGPTGARGRDFTYTPLVDGVVRFETTRPLRPREGLTVAVAWPVGYVDRPTETDKAFYFISDNSALIAGLFGLALLFLYYLHVWTKVGRDPEAGVIVPQYEPPGHISPAGARYVMRFGFDDKVFTAAIVSMAVKGFLTISEDDSDDFTLQATGKKAPLTPGESAVARSLFPYGTGSIELDRKNHKELQAAQKKLQTRLRNEFEKTHFVRNTWYFVPGLALSLLALGVLALAADEPAIAGFLTVWLTIWTIGVYFLTRQCWRAWKLALSTGSVGGTSAAVASTLFALPFIAGEIGGLFFYTTAATIGGAVMLLCMQALNVTFYHLLKAPTKLGRRIMDDVEGFKLYLSVAEKDRMNMLNPPERTPELFEKFLPYAIALEVEHEWAEQFSGVLAAAGTSPDSRGTRHYRPHWYSGHSLDRGLSGFGGALGGAFAGAIASASTSPGSSSGSGGGGSSGGGGGGGGGGGW
jgi:hypothetical protein